MIKKLIKISIILSLATLGSLAFATDSIDWKTKIVDLRSQHTELKTQVEEGALTREEAVTQWQDLLATAHEEKDAYFQNRSNKLGEGIEKIAQKNPELAEKLRNRVSNKNEERNLKEQTRNENRLKSANNNMGTGEQMRNGNMGTTGNENGTGVQEQIQQKIGDGTGTGEPQGTGMNKPENSNGKN